MRDDEPPNLAKWDKKPDFSNPIAIIYPNEEDFPIKDWQHKEDFAEWIVEKFPDLEDGPYYLFTRSIFVYTLPVKKKKRKKKGRPLYAYSNIKKIRYKGRPYRRRVGVRDCIAKFEIFNGEIFRIYDRKPKRKYPPYARPLYKVIKYIEDNRKGN